MELKLTKEQEKAIHSLERAFKKCREVNVYFHNCYGVLQAYDGNIITHVDDVEEEEEKDNISCEMEGYTVRSEKLVSWADDNHYVHLKKGR